MVGGRQVTGIFNVVGAAEIEAVQSRVTNRNSLKPEAGSSKNIARVIRHQSIVNSRHPSVARTS
jgi:hypothetical protein